MEKFYTYYGRLETKKIDSKYNLVAYLIKQNAIQRKVIKLDVRKVIQKKGSV